MAAEWTHISVKNSLLGILGCDPDLGDSCFPYGRVALFCSPGSWQSVEIICQHPDLTPLLDHLVHGGIAPFRAGDPFSVPKNKISFRIKRFYIDAKVDISLVKVLSNPVLNLLYFCVH
jgi:hypothetical protein